MTELDKLEQYLKEKKIPFDRVDQDCPLRMKMAMKKMKISISDGFGERHQIIVYDDYGNRRWDAICHYGSYGYEQGLLEIMGDIVKPEDGDDVAGYLTADDVIKRMEESK